RESLKDGLLRAQIAIVAVRQRDDRDTGAVGMRDVDEALGIRDARRRPEHGVDDRVDRCGCANPQRERHNREDREQRRRAQPSPRVADHVCAAMILAENDAGSLFQSFTRKRLPASFFRNRIPGAAVFDYNAVMKTETPYLGEFEQLVLLAILQCGEDAY